MDKEFIENPVEAYEKLKQENEILKEENFNWEQINKLQEKYQQALEEIKGICKQCMTKELCSIDCDYADRCYIEDEEVPTYDICKFLIEKINEVLK